MSISLYTSEIGVEVGKYHIMNSDSGQTAKYGDLNHDIAPQDGQNQAETSRSLPGSDAATPLKILESDPSSGDSIDFCQTESPEPSCRTRRNRRNPAPTWRQNIAEIWNHHAMLLRQERGIHVELLDPARLNRLIPVELEAHAPEFCLTVPHYLDLATRTSGQWVPFGVPTWVNLVGHKFGKRASWRDLASWDGTPATEPSCGRRIYVESNTKRSPQHGTAAWDTSRFAEFFWQPAATDAGPDAGVW